MEEKKDSMETEKEETEELEENFEEGEEEEQDWGEESIPDTSLYRFVKRVPQRLPTKKNDIYLSTSSKFNSIFHRVVKLFEEGENEVIIHGLGAAINRTVKLSLFIVRKSLGALYLSVNTSTVTLIDDYIPLKDGLPPIQQTRYNSAIHIKLLKKT